MLNLLLFLADFDNLLKEMQKEKQGNHNRSFATSQLESFMHTYFYYFKLTVSFNAFNKVY